MPSQNVSGIQTTTSGERHIPQSVRADGSVRKEIKVRPGYRPPEDVERYKNRTAEDWKSRASAGPPGSEWLKDQSGPSSESKSKNAKRRELRRKAKQTEESENAGEGDDTHVALVLDVPTEPTEQEPQNSSIAEANAMTEAEKQARNIKKKLKQARDLQDKKESGKTLLPEQFAKVIKISELIRQLDLLGFDSNGDPKPQEPQ